MRTLTCLLFTSAAVAQMLKQSRSLVIDFDEEDHLQATIMLAFCYVELEDYDCLESVISDISPKTAEYSLLMLWSTYRQTQGVERDALREMRTRHKVWWEEFTAAEHPLDEAFLDVTVNKLDIPLAVEIAREIKHRIREELGLVASAGVSYNKFLAKIAVCWVMSPEINIFMSLSLARVM